MPFVSIAFGLILNVLGVLAYFLSDRASVTALIPAFLGEVFILLGVLSLVFPAQRKHFMHAAAAFGVLSFGGTVGGISKFIQYLQNDVVKQLDGGKVLLSNGLETRPMAVGVQSIVAVLAVIFVAICVRSFIAARKRRQLAGGQEVA